MKNDKTASRPAAKRVPSANLASFVRRAGLDRVIQIFGPHPAKGRAPVKRKRRGLKAT